jgi:hypothetical protein
VTATQPLVALLVLALLVHLGMAIRTAIALRRVGVPAPRAWTASLLAWPLVRRLVAGHSYEAGEADGTGEADDVGEAGGTGEADDVDEAGGTGDRDDLTG